MFLLDNLLLVARARPRQHAVRLLIRIRSDKISFVQIRSNQITDELEHGVEGGDEVVGAALVEALVRAHSREALRAAEGRAVPAAPHLQREFALRRSANSQECYLPGIVEVATHEAEVEQVDRGGC